jgi:hypothetical protein
VQKLIVLGMCAGARVGLKAAYQDPRVDSAVAWSVPIISGPPNMPASPGAVMSDVAARGFLRHWAPKLFSYSSWRDYLESGQTLRAALKSFWRVAKGVPPELLVGRSAHQMDFLTALDGYIDSPRRILLAYGENDATSLTEFRVATPRSRTVGAGCAGPSLFPMRITPSPRLPRKRLSSSRRASGSNGTTRPPVKGREPREPRLLQKHHPYDLLLHRA